MSFIKEKTEDNIHTVPDSAGDNVSSIMCTGGTSLQIGDQFFQHFSDINKAHRPVYQHYNQKNHQALAPVSCTLSAQYLVVDHMSIHYMKIDKAQSAVDSNPPKCLITSQKMRDRRTRDHIIRSSQLPPSSFMSHTYMKEDEDTFTSKPENIDEMFPSYMRSSLLAKSKGHYSAAFGSKSHAELNHSTHGSSQLQQQTGKPQHRPVMVTCAASKWPTTSYNSLVNSISHTVIPVYDLVKRTYRGDVLDERSHLFTEPGMPFVPRTLKSNHESKLKNSRYYNPPRIKSCSQRVENKRLQHLEENKRLHRSTSAGILDTSQLCKSMMMDISVHTQDEKSDHRTQPLNISMNKDHMNWLKDQVNKEKIQVCESDQVKSIHTPEVHHGRHFSLCQDGQREAIKLETQRRDEENKYLAFAKEVTEDVLSRGIFSDSVLYRVFENQVERQKHDLDENRMKNVIQDLCKSIGLRQPPLDAQPVASLLASNYRNDVRRAQPQHTTCNCINEGHMQDDSNKLATEKSLIIKNISPLKVMEDILKNQETLNVMEDTSKNHKPLNVMEDISKNHKPLNVMEDISKNHKPLNAMEDASKNHEPLNVKEDISKNHKPLNVMEDISKNHKPLNVMEDASKNHEPLNVKEDISKNHKPLNVMEDISKNHKPLNVMEDISKNHKPLNVMEDISKNDEPLNVIKDIFKNDEPLNVIEDTSKNHEPLNVIKDTSKNHKPLNVVINYSDLNSTLESTSTMKFGQTENIFSTVRSEADLQAVWTLNDRLDDDMEMTLTQALKQYQLSLTAKENNDINSDVREHFSSDGTLSETKVLLQERAGETSDLLSSAIRTQGSNCTVRHTQQEEVINF